MIKPDILSEVILSLSKYEGRPSPTLRQAQGDATLFEII